MQENLEQKTSEQEFIQWMYKEFNRLMFYIVRKYVSEQSQQEEIIQESLRKLIEKAERLQQFQRPILASYIVSTVRNTSIDFLKTSQKESDRIISLDTLATDDPPEIETIDEGLILKEKIALLRKVWPELDTETKVLLEGKYTLGYDNKKLGQLLGCQPSSVRMKLTRARRKALTLIQKEGSKLDKA